MKDLPGNLERVIPRPLDEQQLKAAMQHAPVVLLTGPRQAGKSTLAHGVVDAPPSNVFDLEDPRDLARLGEPTLSLPALAGTILIDEAQRRQDLFPVLRVLVDEDRRPGRFVMLGSASPALVGLASESLAGRIALVELGGFRLSDVGAGTIDTLWLRGALPPSFLGADDESSAAWRDNYITTFLERDLGNLGFRMPATTMRRFWTMIAHYHGQKWNGSELARAVGTSEATVRRYLDALTDALVVRQLQPWFANIAKRQVRSPKIYVRDTGILHRLLGIGSAHELLGHPKVGASWEGFVIEQILQSGVSEPWFWATQGGAEIDLIVSVGAKRVGVEVKRTDSPRLTPSIAHALRDLQLDRVIVAHAGKHDFQLAERVDALSAPSLLVRGLAGVLG